MTEPAADAALDPTARIDEMLAAQPPDRRAALQTLRQQIAVAAPDAVEAISYGAPAFRYHGRPLVAYAAAKTHCAFYPMSPAVIEAHGDELRDWDTAKGTIRFRVDHPLPADLVERIVRERMAEIDA